jgi:hypothetical protein
MHGAARIDTALSSLTLLATTGTLPCCAIPIALVTIGLGATVVAATSAFPAVIVLSEYKTALFVGAALLLGMSAWLSYRPDRACPADPVSAESCRRAQRWNRRVLHGSAIVWSVGFFFAYLALPLKLALGG